jgi:hypothetical protein
LEDDVLERSKTMGMATQDMARLRGEITGLRGARGELLQTLAQDARERGNTVAAMQGHFHDAHAAMARTSKKERLAFVSAIRADVCSMQSDFHKDLACIRDENARTARQTRQECASFVSGLKTGVSGMRAGFTSCHSQMARRTKIERLAFIADQKISVSAMRAGFRHDRTEMANSAKNSRLGFLSNLRDDLSGMRAGFREELAHCCRSNAEMFKKAGTDRSVFVGGLKQVVANMRQEFASEIAGSRLAWLGLTGLEEQPGVKTSRRKAALWEQEQQEAEGAAGEFFEFEPLLEAKREPVAPETWREDVRHVEAANKPSASEEKRASKKEKRHR